jgi:hypothetical protein
VLEVSVAVLQCSHEAVAARRTGELESAHGPTDRPHSSEGHTAANPIRVGVGGESEMGCSVPVLEVAVAALQHGALVELFVIPRTAT